MSPAPSQPNAKSRAALTPTNVLWVGAGALAVFTLTRKPLLGLALAGATGAAAYKRVKAQSPRGDYAATANYLVNASPEQAYTSWRNFAQLPSFMSHLKSVRVLDDRRSEWVAYGPLDREITWQAEITRDSENQQISWQSLPGSQVSNSGSVTFVPDAQGRGTLVVAQVRYTLPLGPLAKALVTALGKNPQFVLKEDLRRFKALLEAGEAPTTVGQSHGPRGLSGRAKESLFRETSNRPDSQALSPDRVEDRQLQTA